MEIIKPEARFFDDYLSACQESVNHNITEWMPVQPDRFESWKENAEGIFEALESGIGLPEGYPRTITRWCVEGDHFLGEIQIRPDLTEELAKSYGHIGYAVRYSRWGGGLGTALLKCAVEMLRECGVRPIYIDCHADNIGSNRVAHKNGFSIFETREQENLYILW